MDEKRICDYFVVAGVPDIPRTHEDVYQPTLDPITDISVIIRSQYEPIPKGYICIETTPSGNIADLNHGSFRSPKIFLCYKRGRDKPPLVDIGVWYKESNEKVNSQCCVLEKTHSGFSANVNNSGTHTYLTYWRSSKKTPYNQLVVSDICVIFANKNENPPPAYKVIEKNLNKGMFGSDVFLCYKKSMDRPPHLTYKPVIIDRYPLENHSQYSLPDNLPLFCLPMGATIECWYKNDSFYPSLSTFVLTSNFAEKVYASLLNFYEQISPEELTLEELNKLGYVDNNDEKSLQNAKNRKCLQQIKSICILSHWPFFDQFKHFLVYIYNTFCLNKTPMPFSLESYIFHFMTSIPFPSPERPNILVNVSHKEMEEALLFSTFDDLPVPSNGASFRKLLLNLGSENCLYILLFVLTEQKILLHSLRLNLLTELAEAIVTMIFPFNWNCPYIPMCPLSLSGVLNAPLPFIVGIDSRYFDQFESPSDVVSIDIDTKAIFLTEQKRYLNLKMLPKKETKILKDKLDEIYVRVIDPNYPLLNERDINTRKRFFRQIETEIQDAFLCFMASILKDFRQFLKPITTPKVGATDPTSLFDIDGFLNSRDQNYLSFYGALTKTQMFAKFIEERSLVSDKNVSLAFFDDCIEKVDQHERIKGSSSKLTLIEFDDRTKSNKTVFIAISDLLETSEQKFSYPFLGPFNRELFSKLESKHLSSKNSFLIDNQISEGSSQSQLLCDNIDSIGLGTELQSYMFAKRAKQEVRKSLTVAQQAAKSPLEWAKCLLVNAYSLWFTHFPSFSHVLLSLSDTTKGEQKIKPLSIAYQVLQRMQFMKFSVPDEFCYRLLMILCGVHSQPALAVKVFLDMQKYQVRLNAITYGYYNKAVLDGNWPTSDRNARWTKLCNILRVMLYFRKHIKVDSVKACLNSEQEPQAELMCNEIGMQNGQSFYSTQAGILMSCDLPRTKKKILSNKTENLSNCEKNRKRHKSNDVKSNVSEVEIIKTMEYFKNANKAVNSAKPLNGEEYSNANEVPNGHSKSHNKEMLKDHSFSESFSGRFSAPIKDVVADIFSPKSRVGLTLRSSFRIAKNFTKTSKYGFVRNSPIHNSDKHLNNISSLRGKGVDETIKDSSPRLPRSSTLPQTFESHEKSFLANNENPKNILSNTLGSPWTNKLGSGKHSDYVYSTIKLAANRLNELKSSFTANSPSIANSPVKLNMANVMASISQLTNFTFEDDERELGSTLNLNYSSYSPQSYRELLDTLNGYYSNRIEFMKSIDSDSEIIFNIQMLSCAICRHCQAIIYDEEIMCRWFPDDSNLNTKCIYCDVTFVPSLTIYIKDFRNPNDDNCCGTHDPISVPYLSPLVLRKEFENILNSDGYGCLIKSQFVDDHPIVYWNLLWYFSRLNLPSHIPGLALFASTLNSPELVNFSKTHQYDFNNVSIECLWDNEKFYENTPLHYLWLKIKNDKLNTSSELSMKSIYLELIDLIGNEDFGKPIQYLISERSKTKLNKSNRKFNSIYRELLFLSQIEIPDRISLNTFDTACKAAFESLTTKDKETLSDRDHPSPIGAIYCRDLFKRLSFI